MTLMFQNSFKKSVKKESEVISPALNVFTTESLVLAQASPIFHSSCEGKLGIALE